MRAHRPPDQPGGGEPVDAERPRPFRLRLVGIGGHQFQVAHPPEPEQGVAGPQPDVRAAVHGRDAGASGHVVHEFRQVGTGQDEVVDPCLHPDKIR